MNTDIFRPAALIYIVLAALVLYGCALSPSSTDGEPAMDESPIPPVTKSPISGLPVPASLLAQPAGGPVGAAPAGESLADPALAVLDWAGFEAAASYTFDDGQPSHLRHWEALKATGVPMTWYLWTGNNAFTSYDETWKDALAAGHELGNHTKSHKKVADYADAAAVVQDIDDCAVYLRERLGQEGTPSFAYPFGETAWKTYFDRAADGERAHGERTHGARAHAERTHGERTHRPRFLLARTVNGGRIAARASIDPLLLPIFGVNGSHTEADFVRELDGALVGKAWTIFMYHSILPGDNWYAGVSLDSILGSLEHARRGQKMWLDTVLAIGSYWYGARLFRAAPAVAHEGGLRWEWMLPEGFATRRYIRVTIAGGRLYQNGEELPRHEAGFYEVALDSLALDWRP